jgi:TRAP transporter 4TM/12TM fusion protein
MSEHKNVSENIEARLDELEAISVEEIDKHRQFRSKPLRVFINVLLLLIPVAGIIYVLGLPLKVGLNIYPEQYIGIFLGLLLAAIYLCIPATKRSARDKIAWYDWILAALGLGVGLYITIYFPEIVLRLGFVTDERFVISIIAIVLVLEAIRRLMGLAMLIIVIVFISYAFVAPYLPGIFEGNPTSARQLFNYLYLDSSSMLNMLTIAATIGLIFILFGQVLLYFGGGDILNDIALALFGRFRGGPAKAAVIGSGLVGSITGSPVTNVILTGSVTIPLMKRNGYTSVQAGAIEAVSSTGGQIMPPVMGIAAFIIADTLGIPYAEVAIAAIIPALLYFICLFFQVDLIAGRDNIRALAEGIPRFGHVIRTGWMIIPPMLLLVYFLFFKGYTPQMAGLLATALAVVFLSIQPAILKNFFSILYRTLVDTGRMMLEIGIILAAAGIVVGVTGITGLGFNIGMILASLADYGLLTLLVVSSIVSIILGMGMPSVAAYALVAVLVAPTLVQLGVPPLAAHMFVFYFSILSNFTPPVALACFAAAPIAKESPHKIGFRAMQFGIVLYIVPFLFVYAPELLIGVEVDVTRMEQLFTIVTAFMACFLVSSGLVGYLFTRLTGLKRGLMIILALILFLPPTLFAWASLLNLIAFIAAIVLIVIEWLLARRKSHAEAV